MTKKFKRAASVFLAAVTAGTLAAGQTLAFAENRASGTSLSSASLTDAVTFENVTGKLDVSSVVMDNLSTSVVAAENYGSSVGGKRTVIVSLTENCLLDYDLGSMSVSEYAASYAGRTALKRIRRSQSDFLAELDKAGVTYKVTDSYTTVLNAVALEIDTSDLSAITGLSTVSGTVFSATYDYPEAVTTDSGVQAVSNPNGVYATGIYDTSSLLDRYDGSGMTVAILDTGLDYTHEAFSQMPTGSVHYDRQDIQDILSANTLNAETRSLAKGEKIGINELYISAKVPFAYDYADDDYEVYPSYSQHGTHVAGIVAGQADSYTDKNGNTALDADGEPISFRGVAPNAQLVICKVFTDDLESDDLGGATSEDIIAALEDCVTLGVDVINMSLGTSNGFSSVAIEGDTEGALLNAVYTKIKDQGISLICAASNDYSAGYGSEFGTNLATNPDSGTVGSPSTFNGAMSVASINGQQSSYLIANNQTPVFYEKSNDANAVSYDFQQQMFELAAETEGVDASTITSYVFDYIVVPGYGKPVDYTSAVRAKINSIHAEGKKIIVAVQRGSTTFQEKVETAMSMNADAIIIFNNVAGMVRMSLGDIDDPIPAISVSMDAGAALGKAGSTGTIEINSSYLAGPFMNDYSSWGATPDLHLKPDITAHGGEITSTVAGGYDEMSGTSMASPNLAGLTALVRCYLDGERKTVVEAANGETYAVKLTNLTNQLMMSTATTVYDEENLPYSPRKQGAGLATIDSIFGSQAYLYTDEATMEGGRPKAELGEDEEKEGSYTVSFHVKNFGSGDLVFTAKSLFFTETLSSDKLAVAEAAHMLTDVATVWSVDGNPVAEGGEITVSANSVATVTATLTLSQAEKNYIDRSFPNGMYVEGFLKLVSSVDGQCDLTLPFMGFYGDWEAAPMLDYDAFEISASEQDTSVLEEQKLKPSVWATQAYATYYNKKYSIPMGNFLYLQDENAKQIYADEEHAAISCFNIYYGEDSTENYLTSYNIRALYAGLLRNAELVTYNVYDENTGELIKSGEKYRVGKAYSGAGSAVPANVELELDPVELGLVNNGKYSVDFCFYMKAEDAQDPSKTTEDNTYSMIFYVDYEAPILVDSRIRYDVTKDENGNENTKVWLDLDVYDNHYAQSVLLLYSDRVGNPDGSDIDDLELKMCTEYVTPIYNAKKNGTTTVSIEITDFYEKYSNRLYLQVDDYALNHNIYQLSYSASKAGLLPGSFEIEGADADGELDLTLGVNETYKVSLIYEGTAQLANFTWDTELARIAQVKDGEIVGVGVGSTRITVTGENGTKRRINVTVVDNGKTLTLSSLSFGAIVNADLNLQKASGVVSVNPGQVIPLEIDPDPWYYPVESATFKWVSSNPEIATVDQNGNVTVLERDKKGTVSITATLMYGTQETRYSASVTLSVVEPFKITNNSLTAYYGWGGDDGVVFIPDDKNILTIGEEAFKDNDNIRVIVIPKTVTTISERAFINCTALEEVYFISQEKITPADADLTLINSFAFSGCAALKKIDLSNCKTITLGKYVFNGCTSLEEVVDMQKIGTIGDYALAGTALTVADISKLHVSGNYVFKDCASLTTVVTDVYSAIGVGMFSGCTSLQNSGEAGLVVNCQVVGAYAFENCGSIASVEFTATDLELRAGVFRNCTGLSQVAFGAAVGSLGDGAFENCYQLTTVTLSAETSDLKIGNNVFKNTSAVLSVTGNANYTVDEYGAIYRGTELVLAPVTIASDFAIADGTTSIGAYAFSSSTLAEGVTTVVLPSTVVSIGEYAFTGLNMTTVDIPASVTSVADGVFSGSALTAVTIPDTVTGIGDFAFYNCASLSAIAFADGSALTEIGGYAFAATAITQVELPDGVTSMGTRAFAGCLALETAKLSSLTSLGSHAFLGDTALTTVSFGANATVTGNYTFIGCTALQSVTLGDMSPRTENGKIVLIPEIGAQAFAGCTSLASVDLNGATVVGLGAFAYCTSLATVTGLNQAEYIDASAFEGCTSLTELRLDGVIQIGAYAFYCKDGASYTVVTLPKVREIGALAFYGGAESTVELSADLAYVGDGAFAYSPNLMAFTIAENGAFFVEDGVLYRTISAADGTYELVSYPSAKTVGFTDGVKQYTVKEGTVSVQAYAFARLNANVLTKVNLPYSVKILGDGAFYASGVKEYSFESINAPVLVSSVREIVVSETSYELYSLFYTNFTDPLADHLVGFFTGATASTLKIYYPSNGVGYDNFIYGNYFGTKVELGELMDDTTREIIHAVKAFYSVETITGWLGESVTAEKTAEIQQFSDTVKSVHQTLLGIRSTVQLGYLEEENVSERLSAVEEALKPVKTRFSIAVKAQSLTVDPDCTYKSAYYDGERFDMTGLRLIITYDDYSTEYADMSNISLGIGYDRVLYAGVDSAVELTGYGLTAYVPVTVTVKGNGTDDGEQSDGGSGGGKASGCGSVSTGGFDGGLLIAAFTVCLGAIAVKSFISSRRKDV